jgi:phenylalanyl-tRNA synthetase beta chain
MPELPETRIELERMQGELTARGYQEAVTYSFVDPKLQVVLDPGREPLALANPISADLAVMRTSLWPGLIQALRYNQNRQEPMVRLFETGLRFVPVDGELKQERMIGGVAAGLSAPEQWSLPRRKVDFFDLKADVEALLALTGEPEAFRYVRSTHPALHPGQAAEILRGNEVVGQVGLLHPAVERDLDLDGPVYLFELRLAVLERARLPAFRELSRFPAVRRDLALVLDETVSAEQLLACIRAAAGESQEEVRIFDVYRGEGIDPGRKSLAISLTFRDPSRTLNEAEINEALKRVVNALQTELNASLRE